MSPGRPKAQRTGVTTAANEDIVTSDHAMVRRSQVQPIPRVNGGTQTSKDKPELSEESSNSSEDSQTDSEVDEKVMSSRTWIIEKAKHCQKCKTDYPTAGEASTCLTDHNRLRCYFCFRVCKNTEKLFHHYDRAHRRGGPDGFVDCPCCKESIPFKRVSCHVISLHLTEAKRRTAVAVGRTKVKVEPDDVKNLMKTSSRPKVQKVSRTQTRTMSEEGSSSEDSETDEDINEKTMSSPAWIMKKAKHCQKCKKEYATAGDASTCLTAYNRLRCYFCFRVCKNTEKLFQHFDRAHRKGGREGFVDCPCCKESIPFKSVSCHVISMHLTEEESSSSEDSETDEDINEKTVVSMHLTQQDISRPKNSNSVATKGTQAR